jgi:AraC-like DNA-binding protein
VNWFSNYNLFDMLAAMTVGFAVLLAVRLGLKRTSTRASKFLAAFCLIQATLILFGLFIFSPALSQMTYVFMHPFEMVPVVALMALQGPVLFWYCRSMTGHKPEPSDIDVIVILIFIFLPTIVFSMNQKWTTEVLMQLIVSLVSITYGIAAVRHLLDHDKEIKQRFSNIDDRSLLWLGYLAFGFIGVWALRVVAYVVGLLELRPWGLILGTFSNFPFIILLWLMGVMGMRYGVNAPGRRAIQSMQKLPGTTYGAVNRDLVNRLDDLMTRVHVYQDPDLHLEDLADSLDVSARTLSALINGHYKQNFYDFVNGYRARDAKKQLQDPLNKSKTIQRIFEDAGFNSKSTFNSYFKRMTGRTPSEYRKAAPST